jgi:WD40 repeat protein
MTEHETFEVRLERALRRRADDAPTAVDAWATTRAAAATSSALPVPGLRPVAAWPPAVRLIVATLLAVAATAAVLVASALKDDRPPLGTVVPTGPMMVERDGPRAVSLADGRVLIVGGSNPGSPIAELYDPTTGGFTPTGSLSIERIGFATARLLDGRVLVVGGLGVDESVGFVPLATSELYDPATGTFTKSGSLVLPRNYLYKGAITLLDGRVLIAGGESQSGILASLEAFDPDTGMFTVAGTLSTPRAAESLSLLPDGRVLVAGGWSGDGPIASAEIFDPATGLSTPTSEMSAARASHAAVSLADGRVLLIDGASGEAAGGVDVFDPATSVFQAQGRLLTDRSGPAAMLLPDGRVLVAGGTNKDGDPRTVEVYDPSTGSSSVVGRLEAGGSQSGFDTTATLLPAGDVLLAGGAGRTAVRYVEPGGVVPSRPLSGTAQKTASPRSIPIDFIPVPGTDVLRSGHTATLLADGRVLITGGVEGGTGPTLSSAEIFDPATGTTSPTGSMSTSRAGHVAALLGDGRVLITGGEVDGAPATAPTAELYDPVTGAFTQTGDPAVARTSRPSIGVAGSRLAFALSLPDGRVLVAGGDPLPDSYGSTDVRPWSVEVYDPRTASFTTVVTRPEALPGLLSASLLSDGRVLFVSKQGFGGAVAEVYDPTSDTWSAAGEEAVGRIGAGVAALPDGRVLFTGGALDGHAADLGTAEVWDPSDRSFQPTGDLGVPRHGHTATLLPDGRVLIVGGATWRGYSRPWGAQAAAESWDPSTGAFEQAGVMAAARERQTATAIDGGRVLVWGGVPHPPDRVDPDPPFAEVYAPGP